MLNNINVSGMNKMGFGAVIPVREGKPGEHFIVTDNHSHNTKPLVLVREHESGRDGLATVQYAGMDSFSIREMTDRAQLAREIDADLNKKSI